jgi:flavin reductase (DIM6/NTAB) family NADH-FMN oxidoreductase RutF
MVDDTTCRQRGFDAMGTHIHDRIATLDTKGPIWERFFTVAPLVLIGTRESDLTYDLAPKHMATPLGWQNYFGFVCTPRHRTYQNIQREGAFTVSYPRPTQLVATSLAAAPRCDDAAKPSLSALRTFRASRVDGVFVVDAYLFLECTLHSVVDGFGENSLITGQIAAAHVHEDALRASDRDDHDLIHQSPLLAYLSPGRVARVGQSYSFPFPVDFTR